jgi:hypothetical protein
MNSQRLNSLLSRPFNPDAQPEGAGYNDQNPLNIPLKLRVRSVIVDTSKSGGKEGVFVYFDNVTSGCQFTHFNSINDGQEAYIDKMFAQLGAQGNSWMDCIEDLNHRKPTFEVELYRDPRNTDFIRPRFLRSISKGTRTASTTATAGEIGSMTEDDVKDIV